MKGTRGGEGRAEVERVRVIVGDYDSAVAGGVLQGETWGGWPSH